MNNIHAPVQHLPHDGELAKIEATVDVHAHLPLANEPGTLAGDIDNNGIVNFEDFLQLSSSYGKVDASWADGDFTRDGRVGFEDFLALSNNFVKRSALVAEDTFANLDDWWT